MNPNGSVLRLSHHSLSSLRRLFRLSMLFVTPEPPHPAQIHLIGESGGQEVNELVHIFVYLYLDRTLSR